jgi:hypothetical protein
VVGWQQEYKPQQPTTYGPLGPTSVSMSTGAAYDSSIGYAQASTHTTGTAAGVSAVQGNHNQVSSHYLQAALTHQQLPSNSSYSTVPLYNTRQSSSSVPHHSVDAYPLDTIVSPVPDFSTHHEPDMTYGSGSIPSNREMNNLPSIDRFTAQNRSHGSDVVDSVDSDSQDSISKSDPKVENQGPL